MSNKLTCFSQQERNKNLGLERFWKILGNSKWVVAATGGECRSPQAFALPLWPLVYARWFITIENRIKSKQFITSESIIEHLGLKTQVHPVPDRKKKKKQFLTSYLTVFSVLFFIRACVVSTSFSICKIHQKTHVCRHALTACHLRGKACRQNLLKLYKNALWYVLLNFNVDQ